MSLEEENLSVFAVRLRTLRKKAHMTQDDVSRALNIHRTSYTKYETDKACPDQGKLLEIARLFQVSTDYLLGKDFSHENRAPVAAARDSGGTVTVTLEPQEVSLLQVFRRMDSSQQLTLLTIARDLQKSGRKAQKAFPESSN